MGVLQLHSPPLGPRRPSRQGTGESIHEIFARASSDFGLCLQPDRNHIKYIQLVYKRLEGETEMTKIAIFLMVMAIIVTAPAKSALSAEPANQSGASSESSQKDECLLILKNCEMQAESLKQRIQRLDNEIAKGTKVYSYEDLTKLKNMLNDALQTLQLLEQEGKPTLGM